MPHALPSFFNRIALAALFLVSIACAGHANAQEPGDTWDCWYDGEASVMCQAGAGDALAISEQGNHAGGAVTAIPLFSAAEDMGMVRQLAQAVMCGSRKACVVRFAGNRAVLAALSLEHAIELADQYDAALND